MIKKKKKRKKESHKETIKEKFYFFFSFLLLLLLPIIRWYHTYNTLNNKQRQIHTSLKITETLIVLLSSFSFIFFLDSQWAPSDVSLNHTKLFLFSRVCLSAVVLSLSLFTEQEEAGLAIQTPQTPPTRRSRDNWWFQTHSQTRRSIRKRCARRRGNGTEWIDGDAQTEPVDPVISSVLLLL